MRDVRRVLVVDDEPDLVELIAANLSQRGLEPQLAYDGVEAIKAARAEPPHLIILDLRMPRMDGRQVMAALRTDPALSDIPIIVLTARAAEHDQIVGLSAGADDYIAKPFSMRVLMARVDAVLRRAGAASPRHEIVTLGPVVIDIDAHRVRVDGKEVAFTATEFRLLTTLAQSQGRVVSRLELIRKAMGPGVQVTRRAVDVHLTSVRKKLGEHSALIKTVRGVGYTATLEPSQTP